MAYTTPETWANELVTSAKWTTNLKTNILALKDPPSDNYEANEGANYTKTGGSWGDVDTDFNHSITTTGGAVLLSFTGNVEPSGAVPSLAFFDVSVDGTRIVNQSDAGLAVALGAFAGGTIVLVSFSYLVTGLSAGAHTFNLQWSGNDGLSFITMYAGAGTASYDLHPQFFVREIS